MNPSSPKGVIKSSSEWIKAWDIDHRDVRACQPVAWRKVIEPAAYRSIDFSKAIAATSEDYLLELDISKNALIVSQESSVSSIAKARILGSEGTIISPDNKLFSEFTYNKGKITDNPVFRRRRFPRLKHLAGNYASLVYPDSGNYYHWLIESLPALRILQEHIPHLSGVFVPKLSEFHKQSLKKFGVDENKLIPISHDSYYECERMYLSSFNSGWAMRAWVPGWLKESLLGDCAQCKDERLYISRSDSGWRKVINEDEVMEILKPAGFRKVVLSGLDILQQAELFNGASAIVSVHGAGLSNLAFCNPGTRLLEVFPPAWTPLCYFHIASLVGVDYCYMIARPLSGRKNNGLRRETPGLADNSKQGDDIKIPTDKLRQYVENLL